MNNTEHPDIHVDEIMARIKKEVEKRKEEGFVADETLGGLPASGSGQNYLAPQRAGLPKKSIYGINEFFAFQDTDFIQTAYVSILGRLPDPQGEARYLAKLRNGECTKIEILGKLRYSSEGRRQKVQLKGLLFSFGLQMFYKIPLVGRMVRTLTAVANLPTILKNIQKTENAAFVQNRLAEEQAQKRHAHMLELGDSILALQKKINHIESEYARKSDLQANVESLKNVVEQAAVKKADADQVTAMSKQVRDHQMNIVDMQRKLGAFLAEASKRMPEPFSREQIEQMVKEEDHLLDAMYVSFEDQFRGTRQDIKQRVGVYLPDVEKAMERTKNSKVLDVGCGRGEWLEVLKEKQISAMGLDLNPIMVGQCRDMGLDVIESDVIEYLRGLKSNSLCAITGFHIIEHLPQKILIALLDEALRVLIPGGIVIFETPNPENVLVGAHYFYIDPTHQNPLVPSTMQFTLEHRGYTHVEIRRLHKYSDYYPVTDEDSFKAKHMYNEMDFAVIGTKT